MSQTIASPTRLPQLQPTSITSREHDEDAGTLASTKANRRRSLLPQRSTSGSSKPRPMTMFSPAGGGFGFGDFGALSPTRGVESRGFQDLGLLNEEHGQGGSDGGEDDGFDVEEQRRRAFEALSGGGSEEQQASVKGQSGARSIKPPGSTTANRQSRMLPAPVKQKGSMPPPSGIGRSQSVRRPVTMIGGTAGDRTSRIAPPSAAAAAVSRSHLRNPSTVSNTSTGSGRPNSRTNTTTSSSSVRPPSASSASSQTSQTRVGARPGSGLMRSNSTKESATQKHSRTTSALPSLQSRPQFNTYQQHYSPKKNFAPKPATSSFLPSSSAASKHVSTHALTSPTEPSSVSADLLKQQMELLQLHLLHTEAGPCLASFEASAEQKLRKRFNSLARRYEAVRQGEQHARTARNVMALQEWGAVSGPGGLAENVQVLGSVLREVAALSESRSRRNGEGEAEGRFDAAMAMFMRWIAWVEEVWARRTSNEGNAEGGNGFDIIEQLPQSWFADVATLQRRVATLLRDLDALDIPTPGSSIDEIISTMKEQLIGMIEELRVAKKIVEEVMEKEMRWVDEGIAKLELV